MSNTDLRAAVVVIRRKAGKSDSLLPRDPTDLGQTHQDGNGGRQSDAVDAVDQPKSLGKVGMRADRGDQSLEFGLLALLQAGDIFLPEFLNLCIATTLDPVLEARDILADLIDHGQPLGEWQQPRIGCGMDLPHRRGASCDESRIDLVVLGPLQMDLA